MRDWLQRIWRKYFVEDPATYDARAAQNTSARDAYRKKQNKREDEEDDGLGAMLLGAIFDSSGDDPSRPDGGIGYVVKDPQPESFGDGGQFGGGGGGADYSHDSGSSYDSGGSSDFGGGDFGGGDCGGGDGGGGGD